MSMSGLLEEPKVVQFNLDFCGCGTRLPTNATSMQSLMFQGLHARIRQNEHLDVRHCWLQSKLGAGNYWVKRVDRDFNTYSLTALL